MAAARGRALLRTRGYGQGRPQRLDTSLSPGRKEPYSALSLAPLQLSPRIMRAARRSSGALGHSRSPTARLRFGSTLSRSPQASSMMRSAARARIHTRSTSPTRAGRPRRGSSDPSCSPTQHSRKRATSGSRMSFAREFSVGRVIGEGAFGQVFEAKQHSTGFTKAVKVMATAELPKQEISMVRKVHSHALERTGENAPNVLNIEAVFDEEGQTRLVSDKYDGGDLLDFLETQDDGQLGEVEAARIMKAVLRSVQQCHSAGVAHLDIKPENFVFKRAEAAQRGEVEGSDVVLIDFGSATEADVAPRKVAGGEVGTMPYTAPEILNDEASLASDLWSVGVVSYVLLTGRTPFKQNCDSAEDAIKRGHFAVAGPWSRLSPTAKDFVEQLLRTDGRKRLTVDEALEHDFIRKNCEVTPANDTASQGGLSSKLQSFVQQFFSSNSSRTMQQ